MHSVGCLLAYLFVFEMTTILFHVISSLLAVGLGVGSSTGVASNSPASTDVLVISKGVAVGML